MAELIQDTGARGENTKDNPDDPQNIGQGHAAAPGGGDTSPQDARNMTHGQESYPGPRQVGETEKFGTASETENDPTVNNAAQAEAGDIEPGSTADADSTGMAGVNDRPGKDKAHPWNG